MRGLPRRLQIIKADPASEGEDTLAWPTDIRNALSCSAAQRQVLRWGLQDTKNTFFTAYFMIVVVCDSVADGRWRYWF